MAPRTFLLEVYLPKTASGGLATAAARCSSVTEQMRLEGVAVRFVRSIFLPGDEMCFHVFEADSAEDVAEAGTRAAIRADRVVEAIGLEAMGP